MATIIHPTLKENKGYLNKYTLIHMYVPPNYSFHLNWWKTLCFPDIHNPCSGGYLKAFTSTEAYGLFTSGWEKDPRIFHQEEKNLCHYKDRKLIVAN